MKPTSPRPVSVFQGTGSEERTGTKKMACSKLVCRGQRPFAIAWIHPFSVRFYSTEAGFGSENVGTPMLIPRAPPPLLHVCYIAISAECEAAAPAAVASFLLCAGCKAESRRHRNVKVRRCSCVLPLPFCHQVRSTDVMMVVNFKSIIFPTPYASSGA